MPSTFHIRTPAAGRRLGLSEYLPVRGVAINWSGLPVDRLFLHKEVRFGSSAPIRLDTWTVSDIRTGLRIASGDSPYNVLFYAEEVLINEDYEDGLGRGINTYGEVEHA